MDLSRGAYYISDEFKNKVDFSYFQYDHFLGLIKEQSFFNFEGCCVLESIEKVKKGKKMKKVKKNEKGKKI